MNEKTYFTQWFSTLNRNHLLFKVSLSIFKHEIIHLPEDWVPLALGILIISHGVSNIELSFCTRCWSSLVSSNTIGFISVNKSTIDYQINYKIV